MSKMKNYMMDIEEFCDGYFYGEGEVDFTVEEVSEDAEKFFHSKMAGDYAKSYVTKILGALQDTTMIIHINGSNKTVRKLVERAAWFYAEKLMGKRLMSGLDITIKLKKNMLNKTGFEGTAIWEDSGYRSREFTIEHDPGVKIRNLLITLAHEMVHIKQWAKDEMYEYMEPNMVRFKGEKLHLKEINYWDYPWEIEAYGRQLGLFVRFCEKAGIADREDMQEVT